MSDLVGRVRKRDGLRRRQMRHGMERGSTAGDLRPRCPRRPTRPAAARHRGGGEGARARPFRPKTMVRGRAKRGVGRRDGRYQLAQPREDFFASWRAALDAKE